MEIIELTDDSLLDVIRNLPFEEQIRIGRVNRKFHRVSLMAVSETKTLILTEWSFRNLTSDSLRKIMELCQNRLEKVIFPWEPVELVSTFAQFSCPNLVRLDLPQIDNETFNRVMRNNMNSKFLGCWLTKENNSIIFPHEVINENLETLIAHGECLEATVASFIDRFPNLKHLDMQFFSPISSSVLDEFFASCPNIKILKMMICPPFLRGFQSGHSLWRLPLRSLGILVRSGCYREDTVLRTIGQAFPKLEMLELEEIQLSNAGVAALASLRNLKRLIVREIIPGVSDDGLRNLVQCKRLQLLFLPHTDILATTLITLVNECPILNHLVIRSVKDVDTEQEAADIVELFHGIGITKLTIEIRHRSRFWRSSEVKVILENLKETQDRVIIFRESNAMIRENEA